MTSFLYALTIKRRVGYALMVVVALVGVLSPSSSTLRANTIVAAPLITSVQAPTAVQSSVEPGASAQYTFTFVATSGLAAGVDDIVITFDNEFGVPSMISASQITISADDVTGGGAPNESVNPVSVTVVLVGVGNDQPEVDLPEYQQVEAQTTEREFQDRGTDGRSVGQRRYREQRPAGLVARLGMPE